jgi:hypothetical protein
MGLHMNHLAQPYNVFLQAPDDSKGGGLFVEDPQSVDNIVNQTAGRGLDDFESRLADALMSIFAEGITELPELVARLNASASTDGTGAPWSESSLRQQLAQSAALLFITGAPQS